MKSKRWILVLTGVLLACSSVCSLAGRQDEITLLMVPREEGSVQLGMDIANKYPTLLISYKVGANQAVSLNGWTGSQWVHITLDAFHGGDFFKQGPNSALVIEKAGSPIPAALIPPADWCTDASKITTTEIRPLLHLMGQYYDFSFKDWEWFAKRYNLEMDAINPEGLNVSWYHRPMSEHVMPNDPQGESDLQYWISIRRPVVLTESQEPSADDEAAMVSPEETMQDNPLTNDAPAAVILGADSAAEENAEASGSDAAAEEEMTPQGSNGSDADAQEEMTPEGSNGSDAAAEEEMTPEGSNGSDTAAEEEMTPEDQEAQ
jgi:hypothetical protein